MDTNMTFTKAATAGGSDPLPANPYAARRRPRRGDYHPEQVQECASCGKRYNPVAGICGCNDKP